MTHSGCLTASPLTLLHDLAGYRAWFDEHYSPDLFGAGEREAFLTELQPKSFPCVALFVRAHDEAEPQPLFIPAQRVAQCLRE